MIHASRPLGLFVMIQKCTGLGLLEDSTMVASTMAPLRLFYYYLLLFKLTVYLLKEPGVEIEFKEGIPKPAYGRVVR